MPRRLILHSAVVAAGVLAIARPAYAIDDGRFTVRLGAMAADAQTDVRGGGEILGQPVAFNESFTFGDKELAPRAEAAVRFGDRHRLVLNALTYEKDARATLGQTLSFAGAAIPAGSFAEVTAGFDLASLVYDFALVETGAVSLGLQAGAAYGKLKGRLRAEAGPDSYEARETADGISPVIGVRLTLAPSERWRVVGQGQYLDAGWGDFGDNEGDLSRFNALVEYRFTPALGVHAGYDWLKISVKSDGGDGLLSLSQAFKGPFAGVTLAF